MGCAADHLQPQLPDGMWPELDRQWSSDQTIVIQGLFHASWLSVITPTMLRMSLCLLYLRIFGAKPWMRALSYTGLALDWINALIFLALIVWRCSPRAKIWDITVQGGSCVNLFNLSIAGTVMTFGLDFLVFILPIPAVWQLHLPRPEKMAVLAIFMTGSVYVFPLSTFNLGHHRRLCDERASESDRSIGRLRSTSHA